MMITHFDLIVIGGGAAGFFAALTAKSLSPDLSVIILEKTNQPLSKVRISGGGRCNVTHGCFDPALLIKNYPRGNKALLGPFTRFQPLQTMEWFQAKGVALKIEEDGRVFPTSDSSETIIDCFYREASKLNIEIRKMENIVEAAKNKEGAFALTSTSGERFTCNQLLLATGSTPQGHRLAESLGHTIHSPVPSLFTLNIPTSPLKELAGIALPLITIKIEESPFKQTGPLLITHWGFSGPAVLKLSAFAARWLHEKQYHVEVSINWLSETSYEEALTLLTETRKKDPARSLFACNPFALPKNLWRKFLEQVGVLEKQLFSGISNEMLKKVALKVTKDSYRVEGKTTHKEEFVTCGGVALDEVNFKTMESRLTPHLYFAGEILDIDGITGGFNFQNAWTTGWLAGQACTSSSGLNA